MQGFPGTKAQNVYLVLKDRILNGDYDSGRSLPGEQALSTEHALSRITIRRALAQLQREGLIERRRGIGTFATARYAAKPVIADFADFQAALIAMGKATTVSVREFCYTEPRAEIAEALQLSAHDRVQYSIRVRFIENQPFSYLRTWLPERIGRSFTAAELEARPLHVLLESAGIRAASARQSLSATLATPETAAALDVDVGSALIALSRTILDEQGSGIEHLEALYRPDRYAFEMQLVRSPTTSGQRWMPAEPRLAAE